ncbi:hypothetical protein PPYR_01004 [Photinus pyralis]|uniref:Outer dense fiber protein 3 n=2 Tax=Photinus pyralis TaxID=7054 RepID=A0A1Y1JXT0_PHOPY|nr:outer dense fiber protein 3-like protein 2 [Photinus pyralis]KAB0804034.1 hypothetical protein PPYR_01004 [Photinus pyralis]
MPKTFGPGPGAYMLPSTVGYEKHDISRYRSPQYTMRPRCGIGGKPFGPGPQYNIDSVTRYGKVSPPAFTLSPKLKGLASFRTPGPGTYSPEKAPRMKDPRPPAYSMAARLPGMKKFNTPGPNQYVVPSSLGPKVPNKPAAAAYTMAKKLDTKGQARSPGPAQYGGTNAEIYKTRAPLYTMSGRHEGSRKPGSPGPAAYLPKIGGHVPGGISFGRRCDRQPYVTADDQLPCID